MAKFWYVHVTEYWPILKTVFIYLKIAKRVNLKRIYHKEKSVTMYGDRC